MDRRARRRARPRRARSTARPTSHLLAGEHPRDGAVLVSRPAPRVFVDASGKTRRKEPILGYDVRFSAPKSVSLLWAIGSPEAQAPGGGGPRPGRPRGLRPPRAGGLFRPARERAAATIERGAGFIGMGFLHRSSRAGDPALHVHVVTANMTRAASDGKWLSLANPSRQSPLLREAKSTGYVFQAELRAELTRTARGLAGGRSSTARRPRRDRAARDRPLQPAPRRDRRGDGASAGRPRRRQPKSPPTAPGTPRTTASTPTASARTGAPAAPSSA